MKKIIEVKEIWKDNSYFDNEKYKKLYAESTASVGFVPEYNSSNTQKCLSFEKVLILSNISLHLRASAWNKLSLEQLSGILI